MLRHSENEIVSKGSQNATSVASVFRPLNVNAFAVEVRVLIGLIILLGLVVLIGDGLQGRP